MKKILIISLVTSIALFSCQKGKESFEESNHPMESQIEIAINSFKNHITSNVELFDKLNEFQYTHMAAIKFGSYPTEVVSLVTTLVDDLAEPSLNFFQGLGFSDDDFNEMFSEIDPVFVDHYLTGSALVLYNLLEPDAQVGSETLNRIVDCFLASTGIAEGVAVVSVLASATFGESAIQIFKYLVKKLGIRALGGIGMVLMAVEFTRCLLN